ncbi:MAG: hypothetical protein AVDCRST_MAG59-5388, partial [uncultured Thermomicrobiales bacterium]
CRIGPLGVAAGPRQSSGTAPPPTSAETVAIGGGWRRWRSRLSCLD